MSKLRTLDLFSGLGGFSLGLERTGGFETVAFCEIDPFCRRVLAKHWPEVRQHDDIATLDVLPLRREFGGGAIDVVAGGFPCQDVSIAGNRAGLAGERSGLWSEMRRIIRDAFARWVIVENTGGLLDEGMGAVLSDLAGLGYDAVWHVVPASAVGANHERARVWIVAYNSGLGRERCPFSHDEDARSILQNINRELALSLGQLAAEQQSNADAVSSFGARIPDREADRAEFYRSALRRKDDGLPARLDRLRALGNAVVPQIPELIGRAILQAEAAA